MSKSAISFIDNNKAPNIAGNDIKKENLPAKSLLSPKNKATLIVIPDLDIPGNTANRLC